MPIVQITLIQGYDDDTRIRLSQRLTDAIRATIAAPLDGITVFINEVQASSYMRGRQSRVPGAPLPSAAEVARLYLDAVARNDDATVAELVSDEFRMRFPSGVEFTELTALREWSAARYTRIEKHIERMEECFGDDGMVVYCSGTLSGERPDGAEFSGVRFVDRFTVLNGRLTSQDVWNDLAEQA